MLCKSIPSDIWFLDEGVVVAHVFGWAGDQVVEVVVESGHIGKVRLVSG